MNSHSSGHLDISGINTESLCNLSLSCSQFFDESLSFASSGCHLPNSPIGQDMQYMSRRVLAGKVYLEHLLPREQRANPICYLDSKVLIGFALWFVVSHDDYDLSHHRPGS